MLTKSAHRLTTPSDLTTCHRNIALLNSVIYNMRGTHTEEDVQRVYDAVDAAVHTHIDIGDKKRELDEAVDELRKQSAQQKAELETIAQTKEIINAVPRNKGAALCLGMFSERKLLYVLIALCRDNT